MELERQYTCQTRRCDKTKVINANADPDKVDLTKQYIFEFRRPGQKYTKQIPGFIDQSAHPKKYFMPCCYGLGDKKRSKNLKDAEKQMKNIESLNTTDQSKIEEHLRDAYVEKTRQQTQTSKKSDEMYIKQGISFPLEINRIGELPITLEKFLNFQNSSCYNNVKTKQLKLNKPCLFRAGVENNINKSFLAAISYIFNKTSNNLIQHILEKINQKLNIDNILQFHKGNIPNIFYKKEELDDVNIEQYNNTEIYTKLINKTENNKQLRIIINGFNNFIKYINDPNEFVDYTYLWDIVTSGILSDDESNEKYNLVIIKDNANDITNNLSIICRILHFQIIYTRKKTEQLLYIIKMDITNH